MNISRRNTELFLLIAAALPSALLFALVGMDARGDFAWTHLSVPTALFALFGIAHLVIRWRAPGADAVLLPLAFVLTSTGVAFITRLVPDKALNQILWVLISVGALAATLIVVPSLERLGRYKYLLMLSGIGLLVLPAVAGVEINGSKLWLRIGALSIQPGEIARVLVILFLAAYLAENREMLSVSTRKIFGVPIPEPRTLMPLLSMWAFSLVIMIGEKDLGSSLLFFGIFLSMLYAATGRHLYTIVGLALFASGATAAYFMFDHVQTRVAIWLSPFADAAGKGYQLVQSLFAFGSGGLIGSGIGAGLPTRIPFVDTDFIFAAIGEELGLLGACALLLCYLVFIFRGLSTASRAKSDMAAFTATGLVASIGLQVFVIVGGVTALIPLTGITLPFVSRGGSSMLSTFILLALLLRAGDESTGLQSEITSIGGTLNVLGRVALSKRLVVLAGMFVVVTTALIGNLTYLQIIRAPWLAAHPANTRGLVQETRNHRGSITTRDNVVLAESVLQEDGTFKRAYPLDSTAAHIVGYYSPTYGRSGLEAAANESLRGTRHYASFSDVLDAATNQPVRGSTVVTTLDSTVQKAAEKALGTQRGSIIALNPQTGAMLASASYPTYNPNQIDAQWDELQSDDSAPLLDRSRQTLTAPGSTFKIVTLTSAYAHGVADPETRFKGPAKMDIGNAPVTNYGGSSYGLVTLVDATAKSINTVFGQLAVEVGPEKLVKQSDQFGFDHQIPYELDVKGSLMPNPDEMTVWETAWAGSGQPVGEHASPAGPQATVMQMALVGAAIANDGKLMRPYVIDHIESLEGKASLLGKTQPKQFLSTCSPKVANLVTEALIAVVKQGSGRAAAVPGVEVAGKTGTAEVGKNRPTNAWFVGFAPANNPTIAIAVMIEGGGTGGTVAAPLARQVLLAGLKAQQTVNE